MRERGTSGPFAAARPQVVVPMNWSLDEPIEASKAAASSLFSPPILDGLTSRSKSLALTWARR